MKQWLIHWGCPTPTLLLCCNEIDATRGAVRCGKSVHELVVKLTRVLNIKPVSSCFSWALVFFGVRVVSIGLSHH